jgi:membrane protein required for colicin V production
MVVSDIVIGILLLIGFYKGFRKGLLIALASLAGLIVGIYGAVFFSEPVANWLISRFNFGEQLTYLIAFGITFLGILFLVSLLGNMLTKIADFAFLGIFNKLLGAVFYSLVIACFLSVFFMFAEKLEPFGYGISKETKEESVLYKPVAALAPIFLPKILAQISTEKKEE